MKDYSLQSRIRARMSASASSARNAAAGVKNEHPRIARFAAFAAVAGVLAPAGFMAGTATLAQAAPAAGHVSTTAFDVLPTARAQFGNVHAVRTADKAAAKPAARPAVKAAQHKAAARKTAPAAPATPYRLYDSVTPSALPAGAPAASYTDGAYAAPAAQLAGHKSVLWIDTNGTNPGANVLDVEPGDATPAGAAAWAQQRLTEHPHSVAVIYTMKSDWQQVKDNVAHLPHSMQDNVRYWIADPTGTPHVVPGSDATQWYWGTSIDISTANPTLTQVK